MPGVHARPSADTETKRNVKPRAAHGGMHRGADGTSGDAADGAASSSRLILAFLSLALAVSECNVLCNTELQR